MIIQNLNNLQKEELRSFYSEKVDQLQFQVLKLRRTLAKRQAQEQKWLEDLAIYEQRKQEGEAALRILSESNPYYHKIRLDIQKCEIRIMELEIRFQRFTLVQKVEKITDLLAMEATIRYYQGLILELENTKPVQALQNISHLLVDRPLDFKLFAQEAFSLDIEPTVLMQLLQSSKLQQRFLRRAI
jgi:hypothetical protein